MRFSFPILLLAWPLWAGTFECGGQLSVEEGYRFSGNSPDTTRTEALVNGKYSLSGTPLEFAGSAWAWKNFSAGNYGLTDNEIALRSATASYWGNNVGLSAGLQQIHWGETFGFQPVDLINARNYKDYSILDAGRNRIPAPLAMGFVTLGRMKFTAIGNPRGETPILPDTYNGIPIVTSTDYNQLFKHPEYGGKVTVGLEDSNFDAFAYRSLNRYPIFSVVPTVAGPELSSYYETVTSFGVTGSKGFDEWVVRADTLWVPGHPVSVRAADNSVSARKDLASFTGGTDWSPKAIDNFTVGLQAHWDRYPVLNEDTIYAGSLLIRKGFWNQKFELEAQAYQGFNVNDQRGQLSGKLHVGSSWEIKCIGEVAHIENNSPVRFLKPPSRVATSVGYSF